MYWGGRLAIDQADPGSSQDEAVLLASYINIHHVEYVTVLWPEKKNKYIISQRTN